MKLRFNMHPTWQYTKNQYILVNNAEIDFFGLGMEPQPCYCDLIIDTFLEITTLMIILFI